MLIPCRPELLLPMLYCEQEKVPLDHLVEPAENLLPNSETQLVWELYYLCDSAEQWGTGKLSCLVGTLGSKAAGIVALWCHPSWGYEHGANRQKRHLTGFPLGGETLHKNFRSQAPRAKSPSQRHLPVWGSITQTSTLKRLLESRPLLQLFPLFLEDC